MNSIEPIESVDDENFSKKKQENPKSSGALLEDQVQSFVEEVRR